MNLFITFCLKNEFMSKLYKFLLYNLSDIIYLYEKEIIKSSTHFSIATIKGLVSML